MINPIQNKFGTIFVHVTDLERSIKWYSKLLNQKVHTENHSGPVYTFNMGDSLPGLTLDNHCWDEVYEFQPSNHPMFNMNTNDIHEAYRFVKEELKAKITTEIEEFPDLADFCFSDPDGNIIMACMCK
ncbi:VOC family protein [Paenibacillus sp. Marseille-Q4541]|uniref:VOC family protein n=1 Tax=Paenibacillus sp. Marseille-Q4541 TaxID=2831522 RepID=UPI002018592C|nr:VOC family protein [Paenibacillus sp. Marseille-Q4541]